MATWDLARIDRLLYHRMKRILLFRTLIAISVAVATAAVSSADPTKQWSHGNPTGDEQYALEVLNRVRRDPKAAIDFYLAQNATLMPSIIKGYSFFGTKDGVSEIKARISTIMDQYAASTAGGKDLANLAPLPKPPLALYPLYSQYARDQIPALLLPKTVSFSDGSTVTFPGLNLTVDTSGFPGTVSPIPTSTYYVGDTQQTPSISGPNATGGTATIRGGSPANIPSRIDGFSRDQLLWGVNLYDSRISLREQLFVNLPAYFRDSYTSNTPSFPAGSSDPNFKPNYGHDRLVGIALSDVRTGAGAGGRTLSLFATDIEAFGTSDLPFGTDNTVFLIGTVYRDDDKNNEYTPGEGFANVTVTPSVGEYYAVTSSSGGYAIPVQKNVGSVKLTISQPGTDFTTTTVYVNFASAGSGASLTTSVGSDNVKVDFVVAQKRAAQVNIAPSTSGAPPLVNLSTRGVAEPGQNVLIGGFVINGASTAKKKVLIRAMGYTMGQFGVRAYLPKPLLKVYQGGNDIPLTTVSTESSYVANPAFDPGAVEWTGNMPVIVNPALAGVMKSVGAFDMSVPFKQGEILKPVTEGLKIYGDAAVVMDLAPGLYSAVVAPDPITPSDATSYTSAGAIRGTAQSGIVLIEIYDVSRTDGGVLANLSSRGIVSNTLPSTYSNRDPSLLPERQMIVGYVLGAGSGQKRLVVRGVSPTLQAFGVSDTLDDPLMTVYRGDSTAEEVVDDWFLASHGDQLATLMPSVGAFNLAVTSKDAATVGLYSAGLHSVGITANAGKSTGVVLAEIYTTD